MPHLVPPAFRITRGDRVLVDPGVGPCHAAAEDAYQLAERQESRSRVLVQCGALLDGHLVKLPPDELGGALPCPTCLPELVEEPDP